MAGFLRAAVLFSLLCLAVGYPSVRRGTTESSSTFWPSSSTFWPSSSTFWPSSSTFWPSSSTGSTTTGSFSNIMFFWNFYIRHYINAYRPALWSSSSTYPTTASSYGWSWSTSSTPHYWWWNWRSTPTTPSYWRRWGSTASTQDWRKWGATGSTPYWWKWWCGVTPSWSGTTPKGWWDFWSASPPDVFRHSTSPSPQKDILFTDYQPVDYGLGWKWILVYIGAGAGALTLVILAAVGVCICLKKSGVTKSTARVAAYSQPTHVDVEKLPSKPCYDSYGPPPADVYAPPTYSTINLHQTADSLKPPEVVAPAEIKTV